MITLVIGLIATDFHARFELGGPRTLIPVATVCAALNLE
jgi:hypothetical protein